MNLYELLTKIDTFVETDAVYSVKEPIAIGVVIVLLVILLTSRREKKRKVYNKTLKGMPISLLILITILALMVSTGLVITGGVAVAKATAAIWYAMTKLTGLCIILGCYAVSIEVRLRRRE